MAGSSIAATVPSRPPGQQDIVVSRALLERRRRGDRYSDVGRHRRLFLRDEVDVTAHQVDHGLGSSQIRRIMRGYTKAPI